MWNQLLKIRFLFPLVFLLTSCGTITNLGNKQTATPSPAATPEVIKKDVLFREKQGALTKLPARIQLTKLPYINGKVAMYWQQIKEGEEKKVTGWVFEEHGPFSLAQTAQNPEEVGTVILRRCNEISLGNYGTFGGSESQKIPAFGWKCEITIVDKSIPAVIFRTSFQNKLEESKIITKNEKNEVREPLPYGEIDAFLKSLPQK